MHIINMVQQLMQRLPEKKSDETEDPKIPNKDRQIWGKYPQKLREKHHVSQYAIDRATSAVNCEYLSVNPKASKDNKNHFKELEKGVLILHG